MKSSLKNMVLTLLIITLVSSTAVGLVYLITEGPIAEAKGNKTTGALSKVLPEGDITNDPTADKQIVSLDDMEIIVYPARNADGVVGYAVESSTKKGFSGTFKLMVGFNSDMEIVNIEVLQHAETPGLGSKMGDPDNVLLVSFKGKSPANMKLSVKKDGGDVDAITASTITSVAYIDAVKRAYDAVLSLNDGGLK